MRHGLTGGGRGGDREGDAMRADQVESWVRDRYGDIRIEDGGGVTVAVVKVYRGTAVGLGSTRINAMCDLYLDLSLAHDLVDGHLLLEPWEVQRREAKAAAVGS
jgi:hypothetical protein